jgi:hypothetical protein
MGAVFFIATPPLPFVAQHQPDSGLRTSEKPGTCSSVYGTRNDSDAGAGSGSAVVVAATTNAPPSCPASASSSRRPDAWEPDVQGCEAWQTGLGKTSAEVRRPLPNTIWPGTAPGNGPSDHPRGLKINKAELPKPESLNFVITGRPAHAGPSTPPQPLSQGVTPDRCCCSRHGWLFLQRLPYTRTPWGGRGED